jgi:hypothetical protein
MYGETVLLKDEQSINSEITGRAIAVDQSNSVGLSGVVETDMKSWNGCLWRRTERSLDGVDDGCLKSCRELII